MARKEKDRTETGKNQKLEEIVYVSWEESEAGWGTRPDGCSLHLTREDYERYLKNHWAHMPDEVPDEYTRPAGKPVVAYANPSLYTQIKVKKEQESVYGLRLWDGAEVKAVRDKELVYGDKQSGWITLNQHQRRDSSTNI